jgi:hypothetical protein
MAMTRWKLPVEPTLDDLLDDEIMIPVLRTAGIDAARLRSALAETARRLAEKRPLQARSARRICDGEARCC